jgi:hypothetical protein
MSERPHVARRAPQHLVAHLSRGKNGSDLNDTNALLIERLLVALQQARERFEFASERAEDPAFQRAFRLFALQRERSCSSSGP